MADIQLLFLCDSRTEQNGFAQSANLLMFQEACSNSGLRGFFLPYRAGFLGLFEGIERVVFQQMEKLVRSQHFKNIEVVEEFVPKKAVCRHWYVDSRIPNEIDVNTFLSPEYLAEFIDSKLKPLEKIRRQ